MPLPPYCDGLQTGEPITIRGQKGCQWQPRGTGSARQAVRREYPPTALPPFCDGLHPEAVVIVPPRSTAVPSETAETDPTQRDCHLQLIAREDRMGWQKASGYNKRARVEASIGRYKRMIGDGLHSRTDRRRATEVAVAVRALNRMLELGRPHYVRTA
jgi:hypothetical protein